MEGNGYLEAHLGKEKIKAQRLRNIIPPVTQIFFCLYYEHASLK